MHKLLHRYLYVDRDVPQNFLLYPFLLITTAYGVAFTFFRETPTVTATVIYQLTAVNFGATFLSLWGSVALLVVIGAFIGIYVRKTWLGNTVSLVGFLLWVYAFFLYLLSGFYLQVFALAIPNMMFWGWWHIIITNYHRTHG